MFSWVPLALLFASDVSSGVPGFDPAVEVVVVDGPRAPAPFSARGTFSTDARGLRMTAPAAVGDSGVVYDSVFVDGVVRARVVVGDVLDSAVVVRGSVENVGEEVDGGYGVSLEKGLVRMVRWEHRMARFLGVEAKLEPAPKAGSVVEVVVVAVGGYLQATVFDGDTFRRLAHVAVLDKGFVRGRVGFRVGKADRGSTLSFLSVGNAAAPAAGPDARDLGDNGDVAGAGAERLIAVDAADVARLPVDLQKRVTVTEGGRSFFVTDVLGVERVRRAGVALRVHKTQMPWRHVDATLRKFLDKPPVRTSTGWKVDASYKDEAMVAALVQAYAERFPKIAKAEVIGTSREGRSVWALKISKNVDVDEAEPAVLFDGAHHGGELLAIEFVVDIIGQLLEKYGKDQETTAFVDGAAIWCVPLVNVDGNHRYIWETRDYDRKNAFDVDNNGRVDGWDGVDLYRNYPVAWGGLGEVGSRSWPYHYRYRGPSAASEPEIQAMMKLADRERFVASIDYHTNATKILVPYTDPSLTNPEANEAWTIAEAIATTLPVQVNKKSYEVARNLYPVDGTAQDYFRSAFGTVALLVEGPQNNPLPYEKTRNGNIVLGRGVWQGLLRRVVAGPAVYGRVVDAAGAPVADAEVVVREQAPKRGERWTTRARDGAFARLIGQPGRVTVVVRAPGRAEVVRAVDVDGPTRLTVVVR